MDSKIERHDYECDYCGKQLVKEEAYSCRRNIKSWACDICNKSFSPTTEGYHCSCEDQGFDICIECYDKKDCRIKTEFKCDHCKAKLAEGTPYKNSVVFNSWFCDICKQKYGPQQSSWNCMCTAEGFDICKLCYIRKDGRGLYWDEYMNKLKEIQKMSPETKKHNAKKITQRAKSRLEEIKEEEIIEKARDQENNTQPYKQIMPSCLSDSQISENETYAESEKIIKETFAQKRDDLEKLDKDKLLDIIQKLQLQLGRAIYERDEANAKVKKLKEVYEIQYVTDYPYQSKIQTEHYGLYTGEMVNGKRQGKGITIWDDGVEQLGQYNDDKLNGYGEIHSEKDCYKGEFRNGEFDGHGALQYPSGNIYIGDFQYHMKHGLGKFIEKKQEGNTVTYYGTWKNGVKHGLFDVEENGVVKRNCVYVNNVMRLDGVIQQAEEPQQ